MGQLRPEPEVPIPNPLRVVRRSLLLQPSPTPFSPKLIILSESVGTLSARIGFWTVFYPRDTIKPVTRGRIMEEHFVNSSLICNSCRESSFGLQVRAFLQARTTRGTGSL